MTELEYRFETITTLSVGEAMDFFRAFGRFPNEEEIKAINKFSVEKVISSMSLSTLKTHNNIRY